MHIYTFYLPVYVSFLISLLRIFMAGRLLSVPCVRYKYEIFKYIRLNEVHSRNVSYPQLKGWLQAEIYVKLSLQYNRK